jgi:hypothetical protein
MRWRMFTRKIGTPKSVRHSLRPLSANAVFAKVAG